jgi:uncharacterized protein
MKRIALAMALALSAPLMAQSPGAAPAMNPKVRAITAFVRLDRAQWQAEVLEALGVLRRAKSAFEEKGYTVETVRITTQPLPELIAGLSEDDAVKFLGALDRFSVAEQFLPNVGPAMLDDRGDAMAMHVLARALTTLPNIEASTIIADQGGIHWKTIARTAELVKYVADHSVHSQGTFNFAATAMQKPLGPFYPASYHTGPGHQFAVGFESAGVVARVFTRDKGDAEAATRDLTAELARHARAAEDVGNQVAAATGWEYAGLDPTPAPLGDVSIAAAIEDFTGARFGSSGTLTAARIITAAVKAVPVKQTGYAGLMVPVLEDKVMARRWAEGTYNVDSLLAYSAVCATGLDTVPLPGDVGVEQLERMYSDVASLAFKWNKPLSARLEPVAGKKAGDMTEFEDPYLFNTRIRELP